MNDADHTQVLLEDIQDKIARLTEALADVPENVRSLRADVDELKADVSTIKVAISDQAQTEEVQVERLHRLEAVVSDHDGQLGELRRRAA